MLKDISMHVLDIAQNSITAGSVLIEIGIDIDRSKDLLRITVTDNGCGMDKETVKNAIDPFVTSRTERKVGLGISFFQAGALACDGSFNLKSNFGSGTAVEAEYRLSHVDTPPLGDLASTMLALVIPNEQIDFILVCNADDAVFNFDTRKIRAALGEDIPFCTPEVFQWIQKFLYQGISAIYGGEYL